MVVNSVQKQTKGVKMCSCAQNTLGSPRDMVLLVSRALSKKGRVMRVRLG